MSQQDLESHGVLLPEEEWGEHTLKTTVPQTGLAALFVVAVVAIVAMYVGDGARLTWIAMGVFLLALYAITWLCDRAVRKQRQRFRAERREGREREASERGPA
jgi:hypothetical protein